MWRWVIGGAIALLLAFGIAAGVSTSDGGWREGRWGDNRVVRVANADGTETLIVRDDWDGGFPFGIIVIPLVIFGFIAIARGIFGRGPGGPGRWGGPGGSSGPGAWGYAAGPPWAWGGPGSSAGTDPTAGASPTAAPPWFAEWHRRVHEGHSSATPPAAAPAAGASPATPSAPGVD